MHFFTVKNLLNFLIFKPKNYVLISLKQRLLCQTNEAISFTFAYHIIIYEVENMLKFMAQ